MAFEPRDVYETNMPSNRWGLWIVSLLLAIAAEADSTPPSGHGTSATNPWADWQNHFDAGKAAHARGDRDAAERELSSAMAIAAFEDPPGIAMALSLNAIGVLYLERERWDEAARFLDRSVAIFEERKLTGSEPFAALLCTRADLERRRNQPAIAEAYYRRAMSVMPLSKPIRERALRGLVGAVCVQGRTEEASRLGAELRLVCRPRRD